MLTKNLLLKKKINYNLAILSTKKLTMAILLNLKIATINYIIKKTKLQCFNSCTECLVIKAFYETILAPLLKMYIL